jgi:hypothetical protein
MIADMLGLAVYLSILRGVTPAVPSPPPTVEEEDDPVGDAIAQVRAKHARCVASARRLAQQSGQDDGDSGEDKPRGQRAPHLCPSSGGPRAS